jgi:hypothetical protein
MGERRGRAVQIVGFGVVGAIAGGVTSIALVGLVLMLRMLTRSDGEFLGGFFDEFVFVLAWALPVGLPIVGAALAVAWSRQRWHRPAT